MSNLPQSAHFEVEYHDWQPHHRYQVVAKQDVPAHAVRTCFNSFMYKDDAELALIEFEAYYDEQMAYQNRMQSLKYADHAMQFIDRVS